jgi:hypothetical protein
MQPKCSPAVEEHQEWEDVGYMAKVDLPLLQLA